MSDYLNWDEGFYDDEPDNGKEFRRALDEMNKLAEEERERNINKHVADAIEEINSQRKAVIELNTEKLIDEIAKLVDKRLGKDSVKGVTINLDLNLDGGEKIRKEIQEICNELLKATHYASQLVETLERIKSI